MNQILKDRIYRYGNQKQIDLIAKLGGMNEEETKVFNLDHQGHTDLYIQEELGIGKKCLGRIEQSISAKVKLAVFDCINYRLDNDNTI